MGIVPVKAQEDIDKYSMEGANLPKSVGILLEKLLLSSAMCFNLENNPSSEIKDSLKPFLLMFKVSKVSERLVICSVRGPVNALSSSDMLRKDVSPQNASLGSGPCRPFACRAK